MDNESINSRIICDYDSASGDIETVLDDIRTLRAEKGFSRAMGEDFAQKVKAYDANIRKRMNEPFSLVVIGDFKRGKSTLINALIGRTIVPTAVTPETVTINRISFSDSPKVEAVLKNGKKASLEQAELKREAIEQIIKRLPAPIEYVDIKDNAEILKDISIVDTPGIGDLMREFDEQVADYLASADALIYVVSARSPLSLSEQAFLSSAVIPQSFSRVFMVVNMADTLEEEENINKIKSLMTDRVSAISDNIYIHIVSGLDEYCRKQNLARPEPQMADILENNFLQLETELQNEVILKKDIIKSLRCVSLTKIMLNDIAARVMLIKNSLKINLEKLSDTSDKFQSQNTELSSSIEKKKVSLRVDIDEMRSEAKNWVCGFMSRLKDEIGNTGLSLDLRDIERYLQFYLIDLIKNAILTCIQRHQKEVADILLTDTKEIAQEISQNSFGGINAQIADCIQDISWTNVDTAFFAGEAIVSIVGMNSIIGPLYLVGQVVAGFVRQKVVSKNQKDFLAPVLQEYDSIVSEVVRNIDTIYAQVKDNAVNKLDELYQSQFEVSMEAIKQARQILADEDTKAENVAEYLDGVLQSIEECNKLLEKYDC